MHRAAAEHVSTGVAIAESVIQHPARFRFDLDSAGLRYAISCHRSRSGQRIRVAIILI